MQRVGAGPRPPGVEQRGVTTAESRITPGRILAPDSAVAVTASSVLLLLSACGSTPSDVMATDACPDPLHRVLVATGSSATPSPRPDPGDQHPLSASAVFRADAAPQSALPVSVLVDDGTGSGGTSTSETCQVLTLVVALVADERSTPYGTVQPGRFQVVTAQGTGPLRLVDQPTYIREADDGSGAQDYGSLTGWYALVEDPAPGEYRASRTVAWQPAPPAADTARAPDRASEPPMTGVLDLVVTIGRGQAGVSGRDGRGLE